MRALGKDSLMFIGRDEFPLPYEYAFFEFDGLASEVPAMSRGARSSSWTAATSIAMPSRWAMRRSSTSTTITTTRFGTLNHVVAEASCTAEIVWDLMHGLDVELTPQIAEALYVGLVTDTGRFMYENTGPAAHLMAADLIGAGVDVHEIYAAVRGRAEAQAHPADAGASRVERFDAAG